MARPKKYTDEVIEKYADELLDWISGTEIDETGVVWLKTFAIERGFPADYLGVWAKKNKKFSRSLKIAHDIQEKSIAKAAMQGRIPQVFAIFTLKNVAGWRDAKQIDMGGNEDGINPLVVKIVHDEGNSTIREELPQQGKDNS